MVKNTSMQMVENIKAILKENNNYGIGIFREYQKRFHPTNYYKISSTLLQGEKDGIFKRVTTTKKQRVYWRNG